MKVLVIGGGGREHAIVWKLAQSPLVSKIYCVPGNGGIAAIAENVALDTKNLDGLADFAASHKIDLTVVGPDAFLAEGTVDRFKRRGLLIYGPTQAAARLEWSKVFAKQFMERHRIPTAAFRTFTEPEAAKDFIRNTGKPCAVKADGLAAGKGVIVARDPETACLAVDRIMNERRFGASGAAIVIEELLEGEEVSLLAFCDGKTAVPMLPAQDHKRIGDGDTGPNTGGMGTYAPTTALIPELTERVIREILNPTVAAMRDEGTPFCGVLYLGLMLTAQGPKVIEYNARFGDPETQVILPLLESDLAQIFMDSIKGSLDPSTVHWKSGTTAVCVVAASAGYPEGYETGKPILGLDNVRDSLVFHAGTRLLPDGGLVTAGGRVLNVVHLGPDIGTAIHGAYTDLDRIRFEGMYYRKDIAGRELERRRES